MSGREIAMVTALLVSWVLIAWMGGLLRQAVRLLRELDAELVEWRQSGGGSPRKERSTEQGKEINE